MINVKSNNVSVLSSLFIMQAKYMPSYIRETRLIMFPNIAITGAAVYQNGNQKKKQCIIQGWGVEFKEKENYNEQITKRQKNTLCLILFPVFNPSPVLSLYPITTVTLLPVLPFYSFSPLLVYTVFPFYHYTWFKPLLFERPGQSQGCSTSAVAIHSLNNWVFLV